MSQVSDDLVFAVRRAMDRHRWVEPTPLLTDDQLGELLWVASRVRSTSTRSGQRVTREHKPKKPSVSSNVPKKLRDAVYVRDEWCCQRCGLNVRNRDRSLQHRDPRGMGGSKFKHTMANLVLLCGTATIGCHGVVESFRTAATTEGWLVPNGADPEEWPVLRFGTTWMQPGDRWAPAEPHERQIETVAGLSGVEGGAA